MSLFTTLKAGAIGLGLLFAAAPAVAAAQDTAVSRPALWVVRDADSAIYLFGTVHLMRPGSDWMSGPVQDAFIASDQLWLELSDPGDQAAAQPLILQHGLSLDRPLQGRLSSEEFAQLDAAAQTIGLSGAALNPMRPWLAGLTLSVAPMVQAGYDPEAGVDMMLRGEALEAGKPIMGLETMEQQILFFAGLSEEDELAFLRSTLDSFGEGVTMLDQMANAWSSGDPDALYALGGGDLKAQYPHFYDIILSNRNTAWANRVEQELAGSGTVFMAVGALHLAGPDSVQAQLEAAGVTVERIQ